MTETLTVAEVARRLKVSKSTVYREIADGRLVARRVRSRSVRVSSSDLDAYIAGLQIWESASVATDAGVIVGVVSARMPVLDGYYASQESS